MVLFLLFAVFEGNPDFEEKFSPAEGFTETINGTSESGRECCSVTGETGIQDLI